MTDIFDKYGDIAVRHDQLLDAGADPFGVCLEEVYSPTEAMVNGRRTILAGTNNYLGITFDPACIEAAAQAIRKHGTGTTGSRIANGTYSNHRQLEDELASFMNCRHALGFPTGYQANLGMLVGLAGPKDVMLIDADSHASIYDGARLSGATIVRFRHNDPADLDRRLRRLEGEGKSHLVVVEGIYSMLGDRAPIAEFAEVKNKHGAYLLVDEAHSLGVLGDTGRGAAEAEGVADQVDFYVGTFSKSLGSVGGFGASNHPRFEVLRYCSRQYMYTASSAPSNVASVITAIRQIRNDSTLRERLWRNAEEVYQRLLAQGFKICAPTSPIIAVQLPDIETAYYAWSRLLEAGVYVNLAVPPGTPHGESLLRCSVSAAHTEAQINEICRRFEDIAQELASQMPVQEPAPVMMAQAGD
ncbi:serine palmitoyltransferase [Algihabitans albus]|uniref:serine palmitoyltransferase n=1 Tax=Algihabitans albus TaxID=2164067 RepID=UPI000E5C880A|nr:aminotransferase class I/II-fold pyridoxal phosphate-dependent enzyme [Algihabitans albus]